MKSLFWILALFALAVGISLVMRSNEGYVLFVLPPYRAEISLNLAVILTVLGLGVLYFFLRAVALAMSLPRRVRESFVRRKREKAAEAFAKGMRLYLAGERRKAIDAMAGLRGEGDWPALAAALAARAASELGAVEEQEKWQTRAVELDPRMQLPVVIETDDSAAPEEAAIAKN
jgi:HemY protein